MHSPALSCTVEGMADKTEERDVTFDEVKQGLKLRPGHHTLIIISDLHAPAAAGKQGSASDSAAKKPVGEPAE